MKIAHYAFDRGPRQLLDKVAIAARAAGHSIEEMPAPQLMPTDEFMMRARSADIALVNFSALQKSAEVDFLTRLGEKVPFVVITDLYGAPFRPHAKTWAPKAAGVILAFDFQRARAEDFGYRKDRIFYVGPPAHWKDGYLRLRDGTDERLTMTLVQNGVSTPAGGQNFIVFYAGSKYPEENNHILETIITAGRAEAGETFALSWRPRPRLDEEPPQLATGASAAEKRTREMRVADLHPLFRYREAMLRKIPLIDFGKASMQQCMTSADVSILAGDSTDSLLASYARLPFIYWGSRQNAEHLRASGASIGGPVAAERGGGRIVRNVKELRQAFREFRTPEGLAAMREKQERAFPLPETWDTAPLVLDLVKRLV